MDVIDPDRLPTLDLVSPALHAEHDLSAVWSHLRDHDPVHRHPPVGDRPGFRVVTRHADAVTVLRDGARFTSTSGNVLETLLAGGDSASGKMLAVSDGHRHLEVRRVIARALGDDLLGRLTKPITAHVRRLVARAVERGGCDFGRDVAAEVPLATICDLLGVPDPDRPYMHRLGSSSVSSDAAGQSDTDAWTAKNEILTYYLDLAEQRRGHPGQDLVSVLANARVRGRELDEEIVFNCYSLILGGDETTRLAMTGAVLALACHPDQWRALKAGEVDLDTAVEEVLRWTSPTRHLGRLTTVPVTVAGELIEEGEIVTAWLCSANLDEREFGDADRFRLGRTPNRHLTFAYGPHFCVGARVARIQIAATLTVLRELVDEIEVSGAPRRVYSNFLGGTCSLPVALTPAPVRG